MMEFVFSRLKAILARITHGEPPRRRPAESDWLPPVICASDLSSPYFLAMADREAAWYFERR
jgi:hypothetical protein